MPLVNEDERKLEADSILRVTATWMAAPLCLIFWFADLVYANHWKWEFLAIRLAIIPLSFVTLKALEKSTSFRQTIHISIFFTICVASGINLMIFALNESATSYYHGLCLVALGSLAFIPFETKDFLLVVSAIFLPYYFLNFFVFPGPIDSRNLTVQSFFIVSTVICSFLIRQFQEKLRNKEFHSRFLLDEELKMREQIIQLKTDEGLRFKSLSRQFSPQVIQSLQAGGIDLEKEPINTEICVIFVDICNSTEKVNKITTSDFEESLSIFLKIVMKTFLKYDLTIDKFLGDGVMAFCNAPLPRKDFVNRTCLAALEVRSLLEMHKHEIQIYWGSTLQVRMGISLGNSNVGFYGHQQYFKTFTAIGPVINRAARLCSAAIPSQILLDENVQFRLPIEFETTPLGIKELKGFESEKIRVFSLDRESLHSEKPSLANECPTCGQLMTLETNAKGHFVLMCRNCCSVSDPGFENAS